MTISVIQTAGNGGGGAFPQSFGSNVTPGNTVFLVQCCYSSNGAAAVTTSAPLLGGSPVTGATKPLDLNSPLNGSAAMYFGIWMLPNCPGGSGTVNLTVAGYGGLVGAFAFEVAGLGASPVLDQYHSGGASSVAAIDSGATPAIVTAPELILGAAATWQGSNAGPSSPWTDVESPNHGWAGWQVATSAGGTYDWAQTAASSGGPWCAGVVTICAALPVAGGGLLPAATIA